MLGAGETLPGTCRYEGASVSGDRVVARYRCEGGEATLELRHPSEQAATARTDRFALVAGEGAPAELVRSVAERVRRLESRFVWARSGVATSDPNMVDGSASKSPLPYPSSPQAQAPVRATSGHEWRRLKVSWWTTSIALLMTLAPLGLGCLLGRRLPRRGRRAATVLGVLLAAVGPLWLGPLVPAVSIHDVCFVAAAFAIGLLAARAELIGLLVSAVVLVVGLGAVEVYFRQRPIPTRGALPAEAQWYWTHEEREYGCRAFFPEAYGDDWSPEWGDAPPPRRPGVRRVLHVGDSMLAALDVQRGQRYTSLLEALRPGEEHLNLGILSIGPDAELLVLRRWLGRLHPDEVVLHVMPGNDVNDVDRPYACCHDGPLLDWDGSTPTERCHEPAWRFSRRKLLAQGPAPFPLRMLAYHSEAARRLLDGIERMTARAEAANDEPTQWAHFGGTLVAIRDEVARAGIPLTAVVLPSRREVVERGRGYRDVHDRIISITRAAGIRTVDAWDLFEQAIQRDPGAAWFLEAPNNPHFERAGHRLYADWLARTLWQ